MHAVDQSPGTELDTLPYRPRHRVTVDTRWPFRRRARQGGAVSRGRHRLLLSEDAAPSHRASSYRLMDVSLTRALSDFGT